MFCQKCGADLGNPQGDMRFCSRCGAPLRRPATNTVPPGGYYRPVQTAENGTADIAAKLKDGLDSITSKINDLTGEGGEVELRLKDLVVDVFKKHTPEERDALFICGTSTTTPDESRIVAQWPRPWLYSRIFALFLTTFLGLLFMVDLFQNANALPGLIFIGALMVPFSLLVFFWEVNAPRNIAIFQVIKIFFIGGVFSLITTLLFYEVLPMGTTGYLGAFVIGIAEEAGKMVVIAYFMRQAEYKYILNGLLIGAAVGTGFAVFETAGYIFRYFLSYGLSTMMEVTVLRAILALGGHIVWSAMVGAGIAIAKGDQPFSVAQLKNAKFITFFAIAVVLHAVWDMPIGFGSEIYLVPILLTIGAWVVILTLISAGLKQITRLSREARQRAQAQPAIYLK